MTTRAKWTSWCAATIACPLRALVATIKDITAPTSAFAQVTGRAATWGMIAKAVTAAAAQIPRGHLRVRPPQSTSTDDESSSSTPTSTTETTHAVGGLVFPTAVPSNNDSPSKSTPAPISVTVTPSSNPPIPGQAGGHHIVGSRIIAGLAAMVVFVIQNL
ncbi:hypothetical protein EKO27_g6613 [Xylaria grammica]|uniref:Uncharacterized protein n=1 Tax=Xylaria grammica TaxID=363999 RepID=A0A439D248_9PEZI|nr:hypothetical protein EKO27_g6613 [Xylaria grammica]